MKKANNSQADRLEKLEKYLKELQAENFGSIGTGVMPNPVNRNQCGQ